MATTPFPMMNPTGVTGSGTFNQGTGGPGNMGFGNAMNPQPQGVSQFPSGGGGLTPTTSEGATTFSQNPYGMAPSQMNWMENYLQKTYGGGMGALVYQYLMSNGGYNAPITGQMIDAQTSAQQGQMQMGAADLGSMMAASGVPASSSSYTGAMGRYETGAVQNLNQMTAQEYYNMWNESQNREANMMQFAAEGTGKTLANKPNWMDYASSGLGLFSQYLGLGAETLGLASKLPS